VRVHGRQRGPFRGHGDEVVHGLARERLPALRDEEPGQRIRSDAKIALDGSKLVAGDGMLDRQTVFEPSYPEPRMVEVDLVTAQTDRLADAQTMTKHCENKEVIADAMSAVLGCVEQGGNFCLVQKILAPLMGVRSDRCLTFYISPAEGGRRRHRKSPEFFQ